MPRIIKATKPISTSTFNRLVKDGIIINVLAEFKDPIAVLDENTVFFYVCKPALMLDFFKAKDFIDTLILEYLDIKDGENTLDKLKAFKILKEKNHAQFEEILKELSYEQPNLSIDDVKNQFEKQQ